MPDPALDARRLIQPSSSGQPLKDHPPYGPLANRERLATPRSHARRSQPDEPHRGAVPERAARSGTVCGVEAEEPRERRHAVGEPPGLRPSLLRAALNAPVVLSVFPILVLVAARGFARSLVTGEEELASSRLVSLAVGVVILAAGVAVAAWWLRRRTPTRRS